jgi:uncharacterized protein (DUF433 family)
VLIADRITAEPGRCGGRPGIRETRIRVSDVLELLANEVPYEEILEDYPSLEREDFAAALKFGASQVDHPILAAV